MLLLLLPPSPPLLLSLLLRLLLLLLRRWWLRRRVRLLHLEQAAHGLRVVFTLVCYEDETQTTDAAIALRAAQQTEFLRNESWVLGYDLCNEPDDVRYDFIIVVLQGL